MCERQLYACPGQSKKQLVIGDKVYMSANDWEIRKTELEKARTELGETEDKKERCLHELKKRLSENKGAHYRTDDRYLLRFLRYRKYNVEKAYQTVKQFYRLRNLKPDFYVLPRDVGAVQDLNFAYYFPYTDEDDRVIVCLNIGNWDPKKMSFEEICQCASCVADIVTMNPRTQINGISLIWNMDGISTRHLAELMMKKRLTTFISLTENTYPWRIAKVIVPNTGRLTRILYNLIRPLIKKKIADRVVLLSSDVRDLHKHFNPALLPKTLAGTLEEEECNVTEHVVENLPFLQYERSFVSI